MSKACAPAAGLDIREDAAGNTFARWAGTRPGAAGGGDRLAHRCHSATPAGIDGTVGVLGGLEAIRALQRDGISAPPLHRSDPVHFGGADALRHRLSGQPAACPARSMPRPASGCAIGDGRSLERGARARRIHRIAGVGAAPRRVLRGVRRTAHRAGSAARAAGPADVGVVTAIAAPASLRVESRAKAAMPARC